MDQFHERLARVALAGADQYGFCLAGGYAVQAHGFVERPSEDVDLFTTASDEGRFPDAVSAVVRALERDGLLVSATVSNAAFARLQVTDPASGAAAKVELSIDWRAHPPTTLAIGPVLHPDDAVANKVCALYSRAQARDYIDVAAVLRSGRYTGAELLELAGSHDAGFDTAWFGAALRAIDRLPPAEFTAYGLTDEEVRVVVDDMKAWADQIQPHS